MEINAILKEVVEKQVSDLHLAVGASPTVRKDKTLVRLGEDVLRPENTRDLAKQLLSEDKYFQFKKRGEINVSYSVPGVGRFRVSIFLQRGTVGIVIRVIKTEVPDFHTLNLPEIIANISLRHKGLIIVAGPSASGKSTTLAAMVDHINKNRPCHIITLENPIEYLHKHQQGLVNQREIGSDSESFPVALRSALRQDPDAILVGELDDRETITTAITTAETEHLVLAAMHANDAPQVIKRLIDYFPPHQQHYFCDQLGGNLLGIFVQRLLPRKDNKGLVPLVEFITVSPSIRTLIREGSIDQISSVMHSGTKPGMQTMDGHLLTLYRKELISAKTALENAFDSSSISRALGSGERFNNGFNGPA